MHLLNKWLNFICKFIFLSYGKPHNNNYFVDCCGIINRFSCQLNRCFSNVTFSRVHNIIFIDYDEYFISIKITGENSQIKLILFQQQRNHKRRITLKISRKNSLSELILYLLSLTLLFILFAVKSVKGYLLIGFSSSLSIAFFRSCSRTSLDGKMFLRNNFIIVLTFIFVYFSMYSRSKLSTDSIHFPFFLLTSNIE